jgi:AdoMet-dependent heme synthase
MRPTPYTQADFRINPLMFYYETTRACDLVCKHCRASAQEDAACDELTTEQSKQLIKQVASFPRKPTLVLTGGDPLKRADLFELIEFAVAQGLGTALTPSATPLATREAFSKAQEAGISALGISLDGADQATHDSFRGFEGSFEKTLSMLRDARDLDLPVQVNTSVTRRNVDQIDSIAELLAEYGIAMWSVFFLVPVGRGVEEERISPTEYEDVFAKLWHHAQTKPFSVKTTEAPHYRRYVLQQGGDPLAGPGGEHPHAALRRKREEKGSGTFSGPEGPPKRVHRAPLGVTDGRGIMFVSHNGEIFPAGFLPVVCGQFPKDSVVDVYSKSPVFQQLQNPDLFKGICGCCEYRRICGGSRARAYGVTGDYLEAEPDCTFIPGTDSDEVIEP